MRKLEINKKCVYFCNKKPLNIYDEKGNLFYSSSFVNNFSGFFSLPLGVYYSDSKFIVTNKKRNLSKKVKLPPIERNFNHNFNNFSLSYGDNPSKCTINHKAKTIVFDISFRGAPRYIIDFILLHEMGHNYFKTEEYADLYAVKHLLKLGYNPSQIALCPIETLSDYSDNRKEAVLNNLIKVLQ